MKPLRIFYASDSTPIAFLRQSNIWRNNLYLPLIDLGHDVIEFQYDLKETFQHLNTADPNHSKFIQSNRPKVSEALFQQIKATHSVKPLDVFFSYFYDACVLPETIDAIRSLGIVTINWYCNASYQIYLVSQISPHYDWCLVPEKYRLKDYEALGARPIYCQEAANLNIYKPYDLPQEYDVTFVGQRYGNRTEYVRFLLDAGINLRVWGPGWINQTVNTRSPEPLTVNKLVELARTEGWRTTARRIKHVLVPPSHATPLNVVIPMEVCGSVLDDDELIRMYSRSKISLGFSVVGESFQASTSIKQIRLRDFEAPMSGAFYLVEYMEELEEFYEVGKEIVCYIDKEDLLDKIKYYLAHDQERERIRQAGYRRARQDHSWQKRFTEVFHTIGLS